MCATDQIKSDMISFNQEKNPFNWVDLFCGRPCPRWFHGPASYSETGVLGDAELANRLRREKRRYEEAVKTTGSLRGPGFKDRPKDRRRDRHRKRGDDGDAVESAIALISRL